MPFTPFHFGPGILVKAAAPKRVSFTAFVATQVIIDLESLYHLLRGDWPVHRQLHSLMGASAAGLVVAAVVVLLRPALGRLTANAANPAFVTELTGQAALVGGLLGGVTHSLLDAIMHSDVSPLWPFTASNRVFGLVSAEALEVACVVAGVIGLSWLWLGRGQRRLVV